MKAKYTHHIYAKNYTFDPETAKIKSSKYEIAKIPYKIGLDNSANAMAITCLLAFFALLIALLLVLLPATVNNTRSQFLVAHVLFAVLFIVFALGFTIAAVLRQYSLNYIRKIKEEILADKELQEKIKTAEETAEAELKAWIENNYEIYLIMKAYPQFETVKEARDFYELGVMKKYEN